MPNQIVVPAEQARGLPLDLVVRVEVVGKLKGAQQVGEDSIVLLVEGEATVRPTSFRDGMETAITNAKILYPDFPTGKSELHAP